MQQSNNQTDPIVFILQLAYRRGLALRQQWVKESKAANVQPLDKAEKAEERKPNQEQHAA